jgi:hypothetical protein
VGPFQIRHGACPSDPMHNYIYILTPSVQSELIIICTHRFLVLIEGPTSADWTSWSATASQSSLADMTSVTTTTTKARERELGVSGASHGSSGYLTNDQGNTTPLTPYGSSDSTVDSVLRQNEGMVASSMTHAHTGLWIISGMSSQQQPMTVADLPPMKIKVHYRQDLYRRRLVGRHLWRSCGEHW